MTKVFILVLTFSFGGQDREVFMIHQPSYDACMERGEIVKEAWGEYLEDWMCRQADELAKG